MSGRLRLDMLLMLTFWSTDFTAFLKTLCKSKAVTIVTQHGHTNSQQFLRVIMYISEKLVWPSENLTDLFIFLAELRIKQSLSRLQSLLPLPDSSRNIKGDSARRVASRMRSKAPLLGWILKKLKMFKCKIWIFWPKNNIKLHVTLCLLCYYVQ